MAFESILYVDGAVDVPPAGDTEQPRFFGDLNLDQVVAGITDKCEYDLKPFFYSALKDIRTIQYRQEVMQDLQDENVLRALEAFTARMRAMRARREQSNDANRSGYRIAAQRLFLGAVREYCEAVECLSRDLASVVPNSRGLCEFSAYLRGYANSDGFRSVAGDAGSLAADLDAITYSLLLNNGSVTVRHYAGEMDYTVTVEDLFRKFRGDSRGRAQSEVRRRDPVNHIEAQIQERLALLFPDTFEALERFYESRATGYADPIILRFNTEVHFYLSYLAFIGKMRSAGLTFSLPRMSRTSKEIYARNAFDIALASRLTPGRNAVIPNDFALWGPERLFVVTGPNQGGKTTFARMIGQMHYLASLGCPVPGAETRLFLSDRIFTHFERQEDPSALRGKLQDELIRIREILDEASPSSLVILNELFSSTTYQDAVYLSKQVMARVCALDVLGVWVTFLDELASLNENTVSVVSIVDPKNPVARTYKLERRPANGLAYALAIAQKYRVSYESLKERIRQ
jgi:DNA mismatch repair protein MutS